MAKVLVGVIKLVLYGLVFCTPILGAWLVSSLVAFTNGPMWLTILAGLMFFPLLPITWDLWSQRKRRSQDGILTWGDRITLRTLMLNVAFIVALLSLRPETAFLALSTRGDWMLDGRSGPTVEWTRQSLFNVAGGLEWLYSAVRPNPYRLETTASIGLLDPSTASDSTLPQGKPRAGRESSAWPWTAAELHPAVAQMPANVETSIAAVAQYIAQQEPDPALRIKAIHDYVADRVAYDVVAFNNPVRRPPQDAETVFRTRMAVCEGYARLMTALGKAIGEDILYLTGDSRTSEDDLSGQSHAWNAAEINDQWYLIDATWDSGYVNGSQFTKSYSTDYLMPPPEAMIKSHFPENPDWQLLDRPISLGDFLRQPMIRPRFFAHGLRLVAPTRSQSQVTGQAVIELENPEQRWLLASYRRKNAQQQEWCSETPSQGPVLRCDLPQSGSYQVMLFASEEEYDSYTSVGQFGFNR